MASTSSSAFSQFFEPSKLAGLESMRFTTRRRVEGSYSGRHIAKQRGGSGEFVDYREYSPGDDLRRLDWKAMGRTGRSYLKLYQDETDLHCTMMIDCSGSMLQGCQSFQNQQGSKLEWAQYYCTALAHLITLGRDAVGLAIAKETLQSYLPPSSSLRQRGVIHQQVADLIASGKTDLGKSLDDVMIQAKRRGVLLLLSDFLVDNLEPVIAGLRKFRGRGWEVIALHLVHPDEETLPEGNAYRFVGLEMDGEISCQVAEIAESYRQRFAKHLRDVRSSLVAAGCDYHLVSTKVPYVEHLRSFMVARNA